ncbi:MAG: restriction endonuclease subunit S [bacterium]|nr:restriction endonuclease subunit S [bacterium]
MKWERVELGEVVKKVTKGTTPTSIGGHFSDSGVVFLRAQNVNRDQILLEDILYIDKKTNDLLNRSQIEGSDVLLTIAGTVGRTAVVPNDSPSMNCNQAIAIIRPKENLAPCYLSYWLKSEQAISQINGSKVTATISNLSLTQIKSLKIPLPPLPEQRRLAARLDKADALRQKSRAVVETYAELGRSVFLEMFGDPVKNEKGWEVIKLSEVGQLDRGVSKHRPRNAPELLGGPYPLIQTGDVAKAGLYIYDYASTYSEVGLKQSKLWPSGTLCITIAANIAKTGVLTFDACFPDSVVGFVPDTSKTNNEYVQFWLSFLQKIIEEKAPVSAQKNINLKILRNLEIPLPPLPLQTRFARMVANIEAQRRLAERQLSAAEAVFGGVLQGTFG